MQTSARFQAVLDLVTAVLADKQPADGIINEYLRTRKYIGSKDRRFITDWVWKIVRNRLKFEFEAGSKEPRKVWLAAIREENLNEIFDGGQYAPAALNTEELAWLNAFSDKPYPEFVEAECPQWLYGRINDMALCKALNHPAPADFRVNFKNREDVIRQLAGEGIEAVPTPYSPYGIRINERISLGNCIAYQEGAIEVQDEASQLAAILCDVKPEHKIMDYCCGAGGKSLMFAHILNNQGHILAHDVNVRRLEAIKPRLQRLGVKNIELTDLVADSDRDFDRFVIDAPCTGTGTWRRAPDGKFRLSEGLLKGIVKTQREILETGAVKTKAGGRLIYITCSILAEEDEQQIDSFLAAHPEFMPVNMKDLWEKKINQPYPYHSEKYLKTSPLSTGTDGFFISVLEKLA